MLQDYPRDCRAPVFVPRRDCRPSEPRTRPRPHSRPAGASSASPGITPSRNRPVTLLYPRRITPTGIAVPPYTCSGLHPPAPRGDCAVQKLPPQGRRGDGGSATRSCLRNRRPRLPQSARRSHAAGKIDTIIRILQKTTNQKAQRPQNQRSCSRCFLLSAYNVLILCFGYVISFTLHTNHIILVFLLRVTIV